MTAMRLKRYPSPSGGLALGKMGVGATMLKQGKTARDYVQSGLVAMWDGIENAGWGVHDPNAATWKDLIGNDYLSPYKYDASTAEGLYTWSSNCVTTTDGCVFPTTVGSGLSECTVECVASVSGMSMIPASVIGNYTGGGNTTSIGTTTNGGITIGYGTSGYVIYYAAAPWARSASPKTYTMSDAARLAVVWHGKDIKVDAYRNNDKFTPSATSTLATPSGNFCIGATHATGEEWVAGSFYCVRVYSRALTAAEIARNYAIDKERFNLP